MHLQSTLGHKKQSAVYKHPSSQSDTRKNTPGTNVKNTRVNPAPLPAVTHRDGFDGFDGFDDTDREARICRTCMSV